MRSTENGVLRFVLSRLRARKKARKRGTVLLSCVRRGFISAVTFDAGHDAPDDSYHLVQF
jgi:hypothetical protein